MVGNIVSGVRLLSTFTMVVGCASLNPRSKSAGVCPPPAASKPFALREALALAGKYELTMASEWEDQRGRAVRGHLELWAPDTLFQHYEPDWYARYDPTSPGLRLLPKDSITRWTKGYVWRPLIGVIDIDLRALSLPTSGRLQSRDPFEPGVRVEGSELQIAPLRLGFVKFDGNSTALTIERTWAGGFSGKWKESGWGVMVRNGREVADPSGTFCARRIATTDSP